MATAQGLPPDDLAGFEARAEEAARGVVRRIIAAILRAVREAVSPQAVDPVVVTAPASNMWVAQAPAAVMPVVVDTWSTAAAATAADFAAAGLPTSALRPDRAAAYITEATNRLVGLGDDIWQDIATQLAAGVDMGETIPELAARIQAVAPVSEARATTIARTEVIAASNAGSFAQAQVLDDPSMTKTWLATNDPRTRPTHRAADGQTVPLLSAFIVGGFPLMVPGDPTGPPEEVINCFPGDVVAHPLGQIRKVYRRWHDGVLIRIETASGVQLSGTPNHPILTNAGWTPLQLINVGSQVVKTKVADGVSSGQPQVGDVPATFAELYRAATEAGVTHRVIGSAVDFHGDGSDGEVEIVSVDGDLSFPKGEPVGNVLFVGLCHAEPPLTGLRGDSTAIRVAGPDLLPDAMPAGGQVSGSRERTPILGAGPFHTEGHGVAAPACRNGSIGEHSTDYVSANAKIVGDGLLRLAAGVAGDDRHRVDAGAGGTGNVAQAVGHSVSACAAEDRHDADTDFLGYGIPCHSLSAEFEDVIKVDVLPWHGHVYNLETDTGVYTANDITCGNCRCTQTYDFDAGALVAAWDTDVLDLGWSVVMAYPDQETLTAAGEPHSGAMIALVPSAYDAARLEVGEPAEELHTTLVYLGEDAKLTPEQRQALLAAAENVAESFPSLHLDGFAIAIFNPGNPDRDTCVVLEVSGDEGPELMLMRDMVAKLAADALGVMMPAQHVPYIPHVTLAYTDDPTLAGQLTHLTGPVTFDRLRVAFGGDVFDFPLALPADDMPWDVTVASGKFVEAKHKRDKEGQFATMASRLGAALKEHTGAGDPFAGFTREQLRREATKQGLTLSRGESQESISTKLQAKLGGKSENTATAAPTPDAPSEAQRVSDALEDIYVRAANGEITGTQARAEAAAHLDGLKLSAPQLRDLSKQMGITVQPRAAKGAVRDAIVERRVGAPLQARALAGDKSRVEPQHKPVTALATPEPRAPRAPAASKEPRAKREPKPQIEFAGDPAKVTADLKAIRDRGTARDTPDARGEAAAYLDSLKLTAPQMKALARELDVHTPAGARKQDIRDRIIQNQVGAHLAAAAIARAEPGKAAADAIERGPERKAGKPTAPDVSTWHGDLTPGQTQVAAISASPLVGERRQGGMMGLTSLEDHGQGRIIRKNVATRSGSADVRDPDEQADAEQLGVLVAEAVGLRPPAVVRTGQHELEMEFVEGRTGELDDPGQGADPDYAVDPPDWQRLDILDAVINNTDRNEGNYIVRPDGGVSPIDHSMAFFPTDSVKKQGDYITDDLTFTRAEAAEMRARIEATRPEFDRVGRGEWLDDTLARFDRLTFAPDPTPEASVAPARGAVDETRVADLQSRLDALETQVAPLRALELEATQKEFKRGYASEKDSFARYDRQDEIRRLKAEAAPLVDELMALLRDRDGSNLGAVDDPDRDYWEQAKTQFNGVPTRTAPGVTPTQVIAAQKAMDRYRIDDRTTVLNNEKLRADDPEGRAWERRVQGAIDTSRVAQDSVFYRGGVLPPQVLMQFRPGAVVSDKGFQSTATKRDEAESYIDVRNLNSVGTLPVLFEIRTRAGTPAGDAQYGEVVFGSGRSMRIISVSEIETKYSGAGFQVVAEWV